METKKKFKLTSENKNNFLGIKLYRIECIKSFLDIKKGDKGGFVEKESNLSGDAWISGDAQIFNNACISGYARISGYAQISGYAWERSPLQIQGTRHFVCMSTKLFLKIGCMKLTIEEWKIKGNEIAIRECYSESEIIEYKLYIELAEKLYCK